MAEEKTIWEQIEYSPLVEAEAEAEAFDYSLLERTEALFRGAKFSLREGADRDTKEASAFIEEFRAASGIPKKDPVREYDDPSYEGEVRRQAEESDVLETSFGRDSETKSAG